MAEEPREGEPGRLGRPRLAEVIQKLPPELRPEVVSYIERTSILGFPDPVAEKVSAQHIEQVLANSAQQSRRDHTWRMNVLWLTFVGFLAVLGAILLLVWMLREKPEYLAGVLAALAGLGSGGVGGYGLGYRHGRVASE